MNLCWCVCVCVSRKSLKRMNGFSWNLEVSSASGHHWLKWQTGCRISAIRWLLCLSHLMPDLMAMCLVVITANTSETQSHHVKLSMRWGLWGWGGGRGGKRHQGFLTRDPQDHRWSRSPLRGTGVKAGGKTGKIRGWGVGGLGQFRFPTPTPPRYERWGEQLTFPISTDY